MVSAISRHLIQPGGAVPSCREMAETLGIARNTVSLAYDQLVDQGFLTARPRSDYYVSAEPRAPIGPDAPEPGVKPPDWSSHLAIDAAGQRNIEKPSDWQKAPFPFLYGQFDTGLFPIAASEGLARHLPSFSWDGDQGRSSVWLRGPDGLDARVLAAAAERRGVLIEPGDVFFAGDAPPTNFIRLGFASIPTERIDPGLARLAAALRDVA